MQNGVDADYSRPTNLRQPLSGRRAGALFTGAMDYWPNIDAVVWFAGELLPKVRAQFPDARFWIVGMNPRRRSRRWRGGRRRDRHGARRAPYLAHADVIVAPLRIARGIQNKVLEAMAMARPVVISSAPATGLEARSGHDCEIAHSGDEFVSRTVALLADVTLRRTMGLAAREAVLRSYSWSAHLAALEKLLGASTHCSDVAHGAQ
jgi:glycosyltransferase involved in cell wall biosynthesis